VNRVSNWDYVVRGEPVLTWFFKGDANHHFPYLSNFLFLFGSIEQLTQARLDFCYFLFSHCFFYLSFVIVHFTLFVLFLATFVLPFSRNDTKVPRLLFLYHLLNVVLIPTDATFHLLQMNGVLLFNYFTLPGFSLLMREKEDKKGKGKKRKIKSPSLIQQALLYLIVLYFVIQICVPLRPLLLYPQMDPNWSREGALFCWRSNLNHEVSPSKLTFYLLP